MMYQDKRSAERVDKRIEVQYGTELENTAITQNLSTGGMFINTNRRFTSGSVMNLKLKLPGLKVFSMKGKVIRCSYSSPGLVSEATSGIGVQLIDPPADFLEYIRSLVH
jgi:Tfp pilus assembly protein PilZ